MLGLCESINTRFDVTLTIASEYDEFVITSELTLSKAVDSI